MNPILPILTAAAFTLSAVSDAATAWTDSPESPVPGETVGTLAAFVAPGPHRATMQPGSYEVNVREGATHTNIAGAAWDGGAVARLTPPTAEQSYSAVNGFALGPDAVRALSLRFEMALGPNYATGMRSVQDNKFIIVHVANGARLMMNFASFDNCIALAIAVGTVKQWDQTDQGGTRRADWHNDDRREKFLWCDNRADAGRRNSKSVILPGEPVSIEFYIVTEARRDAPNGMVRGIAYRRSGLLADWWVPLNYDAPNPTTTTITGIEGVGGYYNFRATPSAGNYMDLTGFTVRVNGQGPLGPRAGFLQ